MCSEYDVDVTGTEENPTVKECLIVRAANKITFRYVNTRPRYPVFVQNWSLASVADKAYLLPHVDNSKGNNATLFGNDGWIDWYEKHIASHRHPDELEFSVPEGVLCNPYNGVSGEGDTYADKSGTTTEGTGKEGEQPVRETVSGLMIDGRDLVNDKDGETEDTEIYYFPETRYVPGDGDGKQKYTMDFKTREHNGTPSMVDGKESNYPERTYQNVELPDVATLFRNTHVRITATFRESSEIDLHVSIINWSVNDPVDGTLTPDNGTAEENE